MDLWSDIDTAAVPEKKAFAPIIDGEYVAEITDVEIKEDIFQIKVSVEFTITEGDFKNRKVWYSSTITDEVKEKYPERLGWLREAICKMAGVNSTEGKPLEVLSGCKGNVCNVFIKTNPSKKDPSKSFTNVYVNSKIS